MEEINKLVQQAKEIGFNDIYITNHTLCYFNLYPHEIIFTDRDDYRIMCKKVLFFLLKNVSELQIKEISFKFKNSVWVCGKILRNIKTDDKKAIEMTLKSLIKHK